MAAPGTGKTHLAIAIARSCIRQGARGRFFNVVDLVNRLEAEGRSGRQGRLADHLTRLDFVVLDELGYQPFAQSGGQLPPHQPPLRADLDRGHHQPRLREWPSVFGDARFPPPCSAGSPTTATSSRPATKAGASKNRA